MTTAKKLWLGFGTLLTLLLITSLVSITWLTFAAEQDAKSILVIVLLMLLVSLVIGLGVAIVVGRGIVRSEATLRVTLASMGDAVILTGADGRVTYLSPVAETLTGWRQHEARGRRLEEVAAIVHEETGLPVANPIQQFQVRGDGTPLAGHAVLRARDGTARPIDANAAPIRDAQGNLLGAVLLFHDISARKQAEEALRESEGRFRNLVFALPAAVYTTDREGRITLFNDRAAELWGRRPDIGKDMWCGSFRIFRPDGSPLPLDQCPMGVALREGRTVLGQEIIIERPDGTRVCVLPHPEPLRDASGEVVGAVNMLVDITDRKRAEVALRESEQRFRRLTDLVPACVWIARPDGSLKFANQRWYEFSGLTLEQTARLDWADALHPDDRERCQAAWLAATRQETPYEVEARTRRADGQYRWFLTRAVPVRDEAGAVTEWFGAAADIQDQKLAEATLRETDRRKDEFLAVLSHELRNPLAPIRNALHLLHLGRLDDPDLREAREVIDRQVQQLSAIVDDLLDVFRVMHRKITLQKEALDLAGLVRQTVEDHRSTLENARLGLTVDVPDGPVWVQADRRRLCQVVTNLLSNAIKYTNPGDRVTVRVEVDAPKGRATVHVGDSGIGIMPEMLPHIFETFTQSEQSLDRRRGGLGLGLALVKGLVELHGGTVRAASAGPGQGSEFMFCLPLGREPRPIAKVPSVRAPAARRLRILIVEDNPDAARTLGKLLKRYGHEVTTVHTGTAGVAAARQGQPDVVLCDLGLPEMDGYEVASTLRGDPATASLRLIAVSGYGREEDRRRSEKAGFDLHMTKPVDPAELQRLLAVLDVARALNV